MAQTVIGLDIGTWSIKASVLESTLRQFSLVRFLEHHVPHGPEGEPIDEDVTASVHATLRNLRDWDALHTAISGERVMMRELQLPFSEDRKIQSVLAFQLDDKLPQDVEELVYDYYRLRTDDEGAELLCAAVEREWLRGFIEQLDQAEANARIVTLNSLVHAHLLRHLDEDLAGQNVAVVDVGHTTTSVGIFEDNRLRTARTIAGGGHDLTRALSRHLDVEYGEAEQIKHEGVRLDGELPEGVDAATHEPRLEAVQSALAPILRDVQLTLHAHANRWRTRVGRVMLVGGTSRMPGLDRVMASRLRTRIERPSVATQTWFNAELEAAEEPICSQSVALALRHVDEGLDDTINFRQGEFAYESDFKAIRERFGWLATAVAVLLAVFLGQKYVHYRALANNHAELESRLATFSERVLGEEKTDFEWVKKRVTNPPQSRFEELSPGSSAFKSFHAIASAQHRINQGQVAKDTGGGGGAPGDSTPTAAREGGAGGGAGGPPDTGGPPSGEEEDPHEVELKQVQIDLDTAYVKGEANDIETVEAFTSRLKEYGCFEEVKTNDTTRVSVGNRQDWLRFQLKIDISCEEAEDASAGGGSAAKGGD